KSSGMASRSSRARGRRAGWGSTGSSFTRCLSAEPVFTIGGSSMIDAAGGAAVTLGGVRVGARRDDVDAAAFRGRLFFAAALADGCSFAAFSRRDREGAA